MYYPGLRSRFGAGQFIFGGLTDLESPFGSEAIDFLWD